MELKTKFYNKDARTVVVQPVALCIMHYCLAIYGPIDTTLLHLIQKLQNFTVKICVGGAKRSVQAMPFITQLLRLSIIEKVHLMGLVVSSQSRTKFSWVVLAPPHAQWSNTEHTQKTGWQTIRATHQHRQRGALPHCAGNQDTKQLPTHPCHKRPHFTSVCEETQGVPHYQPQHRLHINAL